VLTSVAEQTHLHFRDGKRQGEKGGDPQMIVAGCDVGSATGKALIMRDGAIVSFSIIPSTTRPERTAQMAVDEALSKAGLASLEELGYVVGTGYGRVRIPFANENISEITCHARGAAWLLSSIRTVIDIGGQDCKVTSLGEGAKVLDFVMNDKCAAGTGRFLEAMARTLGIELQELSELSLQSQNPATITAQCSVFAESEVITLLNSGAEVVDVAAGIHMSIAGRVNSLARRAGIMEDVTVTGGCAKNKGLIAMLEDRLGVGIKTLPEDPQVVGALGAAVLAKDRLASGGGEAAAPGRPGA
jgi:predicted CoA-substrate-specific enzyme activase